MDIPTKQTEGILDLLRRGYFAVIFNEGGEPKALIDPEGNVTDIKDFDLFSDEKVKKEKIVNINGIENITVLCKPIGSACCVTWDDRVKCWC